MIVQPPVDDPMAFDKLLSRSWALYRSNWRSLLVPPLIAMAIFIGALVLAILIVIGLLAASGVFRADTPPAGAAVIAAVVIAYVALIVLAIALGLYLYAAIYGIAEAAWTRGAATAGDGMRAFRARAGALFVALVGVTGLGIAAVILALPTLGLALLALPLFTMYVLPAVIAGNTGFGSIAESFRLVRYNFGPSAIAIVVLLAIQYGISFVAFPFLLPFQFALMSIGATTHSSVPTLADLAVLVGPGIAYCVGLLLVSVLSLAYYGFYALVIEGLYRSVSARTAARVLASGVPQPNPPPPYAPQAYAPQPYAPQPSPQPYPPQAYPPQPPPQAYPPQPSPPEPPQFPQPPLPPEPPPSP